jgi:hypothetical protein
LMDGTYRWLVLFESVLGKRCCFHATGKGSCVGFPIFTVPGRECSGHVDVRGLTWRRDHSNCDGRRDEPHHTILPCQRSRGLETGP